MIGLGGRGSRAGAKRSEYIWSVMVRGRFQPLAPLPPRDEAHWALSEAEVHDRRGLPYVLVGRTGKVSGGVPPTLFR